MHHIIINPAAGRGRSLQLLPQLESLFKKSSMPLEILHTTAPMDAFRMAKEAVQNNSKGIVGIGGDGTLQEIAGGMAEASTGQATIPTPLGIMPCGSGNDFVLAIKGKRKQTPDSINAFFQSIKNKKTRPIDLIKADGTAYINIANMGLDTRIVQNAAGLKKTFGQYAYMAAVYKSIVQHQNIPMTIEVNGMKLEGEYALAAACNGQYYGGGMRVAPHAQVDDGKITLCLLKKMSRLKTMVIFPSILIEKHIYLKEIQFIECERFTLHWPGEETLCLDGNLYKKTGPISFEIMPGALALFTEGT